MFRPLVALRSLLKFKLSKSLIVGAVATGARAAALVVLVQGIGINDQVSNVASLMLGSVIQFFGNRNVAFKSKGSIKLQTVIFAGGELASLGLNAAGYHLLITKTSMNYIIASQLVTGVVFFGFSYPLWRFIFSGKRFGH